MKLTTRLRSGTALSLALGYAISGHAQTATATGGADAATSAQSAASGGLEEVVVTARKREEKLQKTPIAITAFSNADLKQHNIETIPDLAQTTPSLYFKTVPYDPFSTLISLRGISAGDVLLEQEPSVGIYIDGVYEATSLGAGLSSLKDVDRVEVLKGPQGTLYGRNTTGGAINLYTKLPSYDEFSGELTAGAGNFDYFEIYGHVNIPIVDDKVALRLNALYSDLGDGYARDVKNHRNLLDPLTDSFRAALRLNPSDDLQIIVRGDYSYGRGNGNVQKLNYLAPGGTLANFEAALELGLNPFAPGSLTTAYNAILKANPASFYDLALFNTPDDTRINNAGGSITGVYDLNDDISLKSITAYRWVGKHYNLEGDGASFQLISSQNEAKQDELSQEFNLNGTAFSDRLKYIVGLYYYYATGNDLQDVQITPKFFTLTGTPQTLVDDTVQATSKAIFSQATYTVVDGLNVTGGVRETYDNKTLIARNHTTAATDSCLALYPIPPAGAPCLGIYSADFHNFAYTAGVDYSLTDTILAYFRTSRGYKAGGQNERGNATIGSLQPPFAPEVDTDYEIGVKADLLQQRLRIDADIYHSLYTQIQLDVIIPGIGGAPASIIANNGDAHIDGAEAQIDARPFDQLLLQATGSFAEFVFDQGRPDSFNGTEPFPKWQFSLSFTYTIPTDVGPLDVGATWSWKSSTNSPPLLQPGYGLLDSRVTLHIDSADMDIALWGKNLTDKQYINGGLDLSTSVFGFADQFEGIPRTYGFEISKRF